MNDFILLGLLLIPLTVLILTLGEKYDADKPLYLGLSVTISGVLVYLSSYFFGLEVRSFRLDYSERFDGDSALVISCIFTGLGILTMLVYGLYKMVSRSRK